MTLWEAATRLEFERVRHQYETLRRRHRPCKRVGKKLSKMMHNILRAEVANDNRKVRHG